MGTDRQTRDKAKGGAMRGLTGARIVASGLLILSLMAWGSAVHSQAAELEYQVKASYLYNFIRFVAWPNEMFGDNGKFNLCVVGAEHFGVTLDRIAGERVENREIVIHRLGRNTPARATRCHLLFISADATDAVSWNTVGERGVLTIGETPNFLKRGGIINLVEVQGRIRFQINQQAAQEAGLVLSSRLLDLALR